ncbi:hypothetical protein ACGLWX_09685 [Halomonas sp. HMF6819]|uniref:hypothetical protein n=1 Tax=Halomonas sp. HMF6819 TaxID=3373085 RepID=UPI0037A258D4
MSINNDKDRWTPWVKFAWILAFLACAAGFFLIVTVGFIDVPRVSGYGTERQASPFVWALAISQSIGAIMLAVLFSMLNAIYQNTCGHPVNVPVTQKTEGVTSTQQVDGKALMVAKVAPGSPVQSVLSVGCVVTAVNDVPVSSLEGIGTLIQKRPNKIEFQDSSGEKMTKWMHLKPGQPLEIEGEAVPLTG